MFTISNKLDGMNHSQPRLTALLACGDNFMPLSWHMPVSKEPFRYAVAIRDENLSYELVHAKKEFSINFLSDEYLDAYNISGAMHGGDKFSETGLHRKKSLKINSTLIEEAYMIYECKLHKVESFGDHDIFIADVVAIHTNTNYKQNPTLFLGKGRYTSTKEIVQMPKEI
jgi:flavin reductase (DIM6/NTAB) family NADH-FMN oxidoreductase RutF